MFGGNYGSIMCTLHGVTYLPEIEIDIEIKYTAGK